jgi:transcription elongation factor Elf1
MAIEPLSICDRFMHRRSIMPDKDYDVIIVECPRCKVEQKVHVSARPPIGVMGNERVRCINCDHHFEVKIPDKIIRGPFPA